VQRIIAIIFYKVHEKEVFSRAARFGNNPSPQENIVEKKMSDAILHNKAELPRRLANALC